MASLILFRGLGTYDVINTMSLIAGFIVTFLGVYLLNISRADPDGTTLNAGRGTALETGVFPRMSVTSNRISMTSDRGLPHHHGDPPHSARRHNRNSLYRNQDSVLFEAFPEESVGLTELNEESDDEGDAQGRPRQPKFGVANGGRREHGRSVSDGATIKMNGVAVNGRPPSHHQ